MTHSSGHGVKQIWFTVMQPETHHHILSPSLHSGWCVGNEAIYRKRLADSHPAFWFESGDEHARVEWINPLFSINSLMPLISAICNFLSRLGMLTSPQNAPARRIFRMCPWHCHSLPRCAGRRVSPVRRERCHPAQETGASEEHGICVLLHPALESFSETLVDDFKAIASVFLQLRALPRGDVLFRTGQFGLQRDETRAHLFALRWSDQALMRH